MTWILKGMGASSARSDHSTTGRWASVERRIGRAIDGLYAALSSNRVTRIPWAVVQTFSEAQGALLSGSIAYYTFLSLLPLLMVTGFVVATLSAADVELQQALQRGVERLLPGLEGRDLLDQLIGNRAAFGLFGLVATFYAGSGFVGAVTACMNQMWEVTSGRNPVGQKLLNIVVVILLGVVLLASAGLTIWVAFATRSAFGPDSAEIVMLIELAASPLSFFLVLLILYRTLPATQLSWRSQLPGAAIGAGAIELLKRAFTFWTHHSAGISVLPRSLVSVVLLLVWLGFFGQIILYGAAFNVVRARQRSGRSPFPKASVPS